MVTRGNINSISMFCGCKCEYHAGYLHLSKCEYTLPMPYLPYIPRPLCGMLLKLWFMMLLLLQCLLCCCVCVQYHEAAEEACRGRHEMRQE